MSHGPIHPRIAPLGRWRPGARSDGRRRRGRTRRPGALLATARWRAWAAALAGRHASWRAAAAHRASARIGSPAMRLRRAARLARDAAERRQAPAFQFYPTVRLSIGPFLRRDFWHTAVAATAPRRDRSAVAGTAGTGLPGTGFPGGGAARGSFGRASGLVYAGGGPAGRTGNRRDPQRPGASPGIGPGAASRPPPPIPASQRQVVAAAPALGPAPLALVLRRLRTPHGGLGPASRAEDAGSPDGAGALGGGRRAALVRDLAARLSRQEALPLELPPAALPLPAGPHRERTAAGRGRAAGAAPWDESASAGSAGLAGWGERARPPAPPNPPSLPMPSVEALADRVMQQIDRRLGAWRDRTGAF